MSVLHVETAALVRHASGRYGDAVACDAIGHYVRHVGAIPDHAWGSLDWAAKWKSEWADAREDRAQEAQLASERFTDVAETLYQVAASYEDTDIQCAADIAAVQNSPIAPFLSALGGRPPVTARPGGNLQVQGQYTGGGYTLTIPDDTPDGHDLNVLWRDNTLNQHDLYPAGTDLTQTPRHLLQLELTTEGRRKLWEFLAEWSGELSTAEAIVRQWGVAPAESSVDLIDRAADAWPGVIANRANLLKHGANAYRDLRDNMAGQVKDLQQYWTSPGAAGAYVIYATSLGTYYTNIADHLQWLGDEGVKASKTIDDLQLSFANLGYEHIRTISAQLQAYNDAANSMSKMVGDPLNALADAVSALTSSLINSWQSAAAKAQATLAISDKVINRAPDFGDNNHALEQPPPSPSPEWRGGGWRP